jgi:hypothetical protein
MSLLVDHQNKIRELISKPPKRYKVRNETNSALVIQYRWFKWYDVLSITIVGTILFALAMFIDYLDILMVTIIFSFFGIILIFAFYALICNLFNRTVIYIHQNGIMILHGPLPLKKNHDIHQDHLKTLTTSNNKQSYLLWAKLKNKKIVKIADSRIKEEIDFLIKLIELKKLEFSQSSKIS